MIVKSFPVQQKVTSFINGVFVDPRSDAYRLSVINPATEEVISELYEADAAEVSLAVESAASAFQSGVWRNTTVEQRKEIFHRICALTEKHSEELCYLESVNLGIPTRQAKGMVTDRVIRNFRFYADYLGQATERSVRLDNVYQRYVYREPVGVTALISPWNAPLMLATSKIAPSLAFGNCCVIKTSEQTPLALARFMELLIEAGVPPGAVNMVNGRGQVTGSALVEHPKVKLVSFTGGGATGRVIASAAAQGLKKFDLELGGKSACIVSDSADIDQAIDGSLLGIYMNSGQACFAGSRILVQKNIADTFISRFVERVRNIRVGDPLDTETEMGPLAFDAHYQRVLSYFDIAKADGATILTGGKSASNCARGYFVEPTVVLAKSNQARVCQEEIFGPVVTILTYDTFEEALAISNDSNFGLAGYLWTNRLDETMAVAQHMQSGTVMINSPMVFDLRMPFGGYKDSGVGREGIESLRNFYSEEKTVAIAMQRLPIPVRLGLPS